MSKLIGIVGGIGPKAGESLHASILANTRAVRDSDHLPVVLYTNPAIPDRSEFIFGDSTDNPAHGIVQSLLRLVEFGAAVLAVPCNTAHSPVIWDVVEADLSGAAEDYELLHIVDLTVDSLVHDHPSTSHVGLLATTGTVATEVYQRALSHRNVRTVLPTELSQGHIHEAIYHPDWGIKAQSSPVTPQAIDALEAAALRMIADGAEAVILGCTEIPLAFPQPDLKAIPLIDSTTVLAREAIRQAAGEMRLVTRPR